MCRDYILVGSDSGRIVILEYIKDGNHFKKIHQETFGKSGCRRIVPGQYMAADPKGRACMIGEEFPCKEQAVSLALVTSTPYRSQHVVSCRQLLGPILS